MSFKVLVPIAPGTEEMEAVTIIDIMVRAGYDVTIASVDPECSLTMKASRGVILTADCKLVEVADEQFDVIALPGGVPGSETFRDSVLHQPGAWQHIGIWDGNRHSTVWKAPYLECR
jgi:4-methyl-5(b-hydroxyethyl)-thiazole monophosphate biosynthesis